MFVSTLHLDAPLMYRLLQFKHGPHKMSHKKILPDS